MCKEQKYKKRPGLAHLKKLIFNQVCIKMASFYFHLFNRKQFKMFLNEICGSLVLTRVLWCWK